MCGITGFIGPTNIDALKGMMNAIIHRGPDSGDVAIVDDVVHLAHRRLSIIDLSPTGHQPMESKDGRFIIVFNGEIYNYLDLKKEIKRDWRGHSDTEVLVESISEIGVEKTLSKIAGMFVFAVFDKRDKVLTIARDRFGEKPLYYSRQGNTFLFGSELKALVKHPSFTKKISRKALKAFFKYNYIPAPYSIYENVFKLRPAHFLTFDLKTNSFEEKRYWSIGKQTLFSGSYQDALNELERKLLRTVEEQMISDVPIGAFLSGGVDSSMVVALMQQKAAKKVKSFSIGFHEKKFNEAIFAAEVAKHLGTDHTELYVTPQDALAVVPKLPHIYDEPFSDSSQIPTYLVSAMTRQHVTVALSGDAGDESFGGYQRYFLGPSIYKKIKFLPKPLRKLSATSLRAVSPNIWDKIMPFPGDKMHKLAEVLDVNSGEDVYQRLISHWGDLENPALGNESIFHYEFDQLGSLEEQMMMLDTNTYLPDDILVKVDRASMALSLETRAPFLDHRVVEFAWTLPIEFKIQNQNGKRILKDLLYKYVPRELIDRPKMGFGVPLDSWLRNELRDWGESLIDGKKIREAGFLNYDLIKKKWDEHQSGSRNFQYHLWDVLMFQSWLEQNS